MIWKMSRFLAQLLILNLFLINTTTTVLADTFNCTFGAKITVTQANVTTTTEPLVFNVRSQCEIHVSGLVDIPAIRVNGALSDTNVNVTIVDCTWTGVLRGPASNNGALIQFWAPVMPNRNAYRAIVLRNLTVTLGMGFSLDDSSLFLVLVNSTYNPALDFYQFEMTNCKISMPGSTMTFDAVDGAMLALLSALSGFGNVGQGNSAYFTFADNSLVITATNLDILSGSLRMFLAYFNQQVSTRVLTFVRNRLDATNCQIDVRNGKAAAALFYAESYVTYSTVLNTWTFPSLSDISNNTMNLKTLRAAKGSVDVAIFYLYSFTGYSNGLWLHDNVFTADTIIGNATSQSQVSFLSMASAQMTTLTDNRFEVRQILFLGSNSRVYLFDTGTQWGTSVSTTLNVERNKMTVSLIDPVNNIVAGGFFTISLTASQLINTAHRTNITFADNVFTFSCDASAAPSSAPVIKFSAFEIMNTLTNTIYSLNISQNNVTIPLLRAVASYDVRVARIGSATVGTLSLVAYYSVADNTLELQHVDNSVAGAEAYPNQQSTATVFLAYKVDSFNCSVARNKLQVETVNSGPAAAGAFAFTVFDIYIGFDFPYSGASSATMMLDNRSHIEVLANEIVMNSNLTSRQAVTVRLFKSGGSFGNVNTMALRDNSFTSSSTLHVTGGNSPLDVALFAFASPLVTGTSSWCARHQQPFLVVSQNSLTARGDIRIAVGALQLKIIAFAQNVNARPTTGTFDPCNITFSSNIIIIDLDHALPSNQLRFATILEASYDFVGGTVEISGNDLLLSRPLTEGFVGSDDRLQVVNAAEFEDTNHLVVHNNRLYLDNDITSSITLTLRVLHITGAISNVRSVRFTENVIQIEQCSLNVTNGGSLNVVVLQVLSGIEQTALPIPAAEQPKNFLTATDNKIYTSSSSAMLRLGGTGGSATKLMVLECRSISAVKSAFDVLVNRNGIDLASPVSPTAGDLFIVVVSLSSALTGRHLLLLDNKIETKSGAVITGAGPSRTAKIAPLVVPQFDAAGKVSVEQNSVKLNAELRVQGTSCSIHICERTGTGTLQASSLSVMSNEIVVPHITGDKDVNVYVFQLNSLSRLNGTVVLSGNTVSIGSIVRFANRSEIKGIEVGCFTGGTGITSESASKDISSFKVDYNSLNIANFIATGGVSVTLFATDSATAAVEHIRRFEVSTNEFRIEQGDVGLAVIVGGVILRGGRVNVSQLYFSDNIILVQVHVVNTRAVSALSIDAAGMKGVDLFQVNNNAVNVRFTGGNSGGATVSLVDMSNFDNPWARSSSTSIFDFTSNTVDVFSETDNDSKLTLLSTSWDLGNLRSFFFRSNSVLFTVRRRSTTGISSAIFYGFNSNLYSVSAVDWTVIANSVELQLDVFRSVTGVLMVPTLELAAIKRFTFEQNTLTLNASTDFATAAATANLLNLDATGVSSTDLGSLTLLSFSGNNLRVDLRSAQSMPQPIVRCLIVGLHNWNNFVSVNLTKNDMAVRWYHGSGTVVTATHTTDTTLAMFLFTGAIFEAGDLLVANNNMQLVDLVSNKKISAYLFERSSDWSNMASFKVINNTVQVSRADCPFLKVTAIENNDFALLGAGSTLFVSNLNVTVEMATRIESTLLAVLLNLARFPAPVTFSHSSLRVIADSTKTTTHNNISMATRVLAVQLATRSGQANFGSSRLLLRNVTVEVDSKDAVLCAPLECAVLEIAADVNMSGSFAFENSRFISRGGGSSKTHSGFGSGKFQGSTFVILRPGALRLRAAEFTFDGCNLGVDEATAAAPSGTTVAVTIDKIFRFGGATAVDTFWDNSIWSKMAASPAAFFVDGIDDKRTAFFNGAKILFLCNHWPRNSELYARDRFYHNTRGLLANVVLDCNSTVTATRILTPPVTKTGTVTVSAFATSISHPLSQTLTTHERTATRKRTKSRGDFTVTRSAALSSTVSISDLSATRSQLDTRSQRESNSQSAFTPTLTRSIVVKNHIGLDSNLLTSLMTSTQAIGAVASLAASVPTAAMAMSRGVAVLQLIGCPRFHPSGRRWITVDPGFSWTLMPGIAFGDDENGGFYRAGCCSFAFLGLLAGFVSLVARKDPRITLRRAVPPVLLNSGNDSKNKNKNKDNRLSSGTADRTSSSSESNEQQQQQPGDGNDDTRPSEPDENEEPVLTSIPISISKPKLPPGTRFVHFFCLALFPFVGAWSAAAGALLTTGHAVDILLAVAPLLGLIAVLAQTARKLFRAVSEHVLPPKSAIGRTEWTRMTPYALVPSFVVRVQQEDAVIKQYKQQQQQQQQSPSATNNNINKRSTVQVLAERFLRSDFGRWLLVGYQVWARDPLAGEAEKLAGRDETSDLLVSHSRVFAKMIGPSKQVDLFGELRPETEATLRQQAGSFFTLVSCFGAVVCGFMQGLSLGNDNERGFCSAAIGTTAVVSLLLMLFAMLTRPFIIPARNVLIIVIELSVGAAAVVALMLLARNAPVDASNISIVTTAQLIVVVGASFASSVMTLLKIMSIALRVIAKTAVVSAPVYWHRFEDYTASEISAATNQNNPTAKGVKKQQQQSSEQQMKSSDNKSDRKNQRQRQELDVEMLEVLLPKIEKQERSEKRKQKHDDKKERERSQERDRHDKKSDDKTKKKNSTRSESKTKTKTAKRHVDLALL